MKKFSIEIEEVLQKIIEVEARDENEALRLVSDQYRQGNVILNEDDYKGCELRVVSE